MPIDTSLPPWLQRNFAERPGFDPSPWLNEAFTQNVERQKLPLQLQQFALQNKALELSTEHQGIQNDIANMDLDAFRSDLSKIRDFGTATGGDPLKIAETPPPMLSSVQGQQILSNQIKQAALTGYVQRHQALETAKLALVGKALEHGQSIAPEIDPVTHQPTFNPDTIAEAFNQGALRDLIGKVFAEQAKTSPSEEKVNLLNDAKSALASAQATKDPAKIAAAQQKLQSVIETMPGQQVTVFDTKTGQPIVQMGKSIAGASNGLTTAVTTEEEKNVLNGEQTLGDLLRTRDQLNSDNVAGIWPTVKNQVFDKLMGNIAPEFVNKERVAGRSAINWTRQDIINQMRQRYGEHAVERISAMLPSTSLAESPENARILADEAIKHVAIDVAKRSLAVGRTPAEHVLRAIGRLSNDELDKEIGSGYLPPSLGIAAVKVRKLPPGQLPPGFETKPAVTGNPLVVSPGAAAPSGKVTWDQLFQLYRSGKLKQLSPSTEPYVSEEE